LQTVLQTFFNPVLPVFAILGVGAVFAWRGVFDAAAAAVLNRFVFYVGVPTLLFSLLSRVDVAHFDGRLLAAYFGSEVLVYAMGAALARWVFRRGWREALLLGMTASFVNHVFFVLPMARVLYGEAASAPIAGIITVDSALIFSGHVIGLELAEHGLHSLRQVARKLLGHPLLLAIGTGLGVNLLGIPLHAGIMTFVGFAGAAAAPVALFALGVVLWSGGERRQDPAAGVIAALKVALHPLLAWALFGPLPALDPAWRGPALLVAAGPCGAMPFVLALQYRVPSSTQPWPRC
jgi:predicted permease